MAFLRSHRNRRRPHNCEAGAAQARNRNDRKEPVSTGLRTREAMMRELPSLLDSM